MYKNFVEKTCRNTIFLKRTLIYSKTPNVYLNNQNYLIKKFLNESKVTYNEKQDVNQDVTNDVINDVTTDELKYYKQNYEFKLTNKWTKEW